MSAIPARLTAALADRYRIERELGQGGMATVYAAEDLKHDRKVALKVLRPELAAVIGAERFLAEIKTTANLQHPHILPLFDSGQVNGSVFYAMPLVEGESLRDRLGRVKQLPIAEAVRIACEVADALDYAHRHGVIHRDIKPENILLHDDRAQVADFGIALAASRSDGGARMTETGMSLGTPHYMSPEQAMGERELDARTDVYALGCVLYEMLAGEPPFNGPTAQAIVARVMTEEPRALTGQRKTVPPGVEAAIFTALAKLPADRHATAADFAAALRNPAGAVARPGIQPAAATAWRRWSIAAIVGVAMLAAGIVVGRTIQPRSGGLTDVVRATITLGANAPLRAVGNVRLAISPDGRQIVVVGGTGADASLWVREIGASEPRLLPGTEGAFGPFFSPDGRSVGFFTSSGASAELRVIPVQGGVARTVVSDSATGFGADWADDGHIYFSHANRGIAKIPSGGGAIVQISRVDSLGGASEHDFPDVLPGSRFAVATLWLGSVGSNRIGLVDLATGAVTEIADGTMARYVAPGFLVIGDADGSLLAAPMDARTGKVSGTPTLMARNLTVEGVNGSVQFAVSASGTLVYQPDVSGGGVLNWVGRDGTAVPVDSSMKGIFSSMSVSPDGKAIALARSEAGGEAVWIKHLPAGAFTKLSTDVADANRPEWSPDGRHVAFLGLRNNLRQPWLRRADASDQTRPAVPGGREFDEILFHPRGHEVLLRTRGLGPGSRHLMVFEPGVDSVPRDLLRSPADHHSMVFSPDGRWLAYVSEESGTPEVYVRPFPNVDSARIAISVGGGSEPLWSRDGSEVFYRSPRGGVLSARVSTRPTFTVRPPVTLFTASQVVFGQYHRAWDVHPDGRFLMSDAGSSDVTQLEVVFNWHKELERLNAGSNSR